MTPTAPFRVLVVDDEPLALAMVTTLIRQDDQISEVLESGNALDVPGLIATHQPHIVFLDIEMPGLTGIQLASRIADDGPVIVFITAFSEYATRAFDVSAVDYVLKPFSDQRLKDALERAKRRVRERRLGELANEVASLSAELSAERAPTRDASAPASAEAPSVPQEYLQRLSFKSGDRAIVIKAEEIIWIEAEDYYVLVHSTRGRHLIRTPMATLEERLDPARFVRTHRGALVNLAEVKEYDQKDGTWLTLSDGARVAVSRARRRRVEQMLAPRLG
jgi:two-component system LytT family response regulator